MVAHPGHFAAPVDRSALHVGFARSTGVPPSRIWLEMPLGASNPSATGATYANAPSSLKRRSVLRHSTLSAFSLSPSILAMASGVFPVLNATGYE